MAVSSIQDRTSEFRAILQQAQRKQALSKVGQRPNSQNGSAAQSRTKQRSEFARKAAEIGKGISGSMAKLERLAQLARRKTLFDDRPVEVEELTFVIKQDLAALTQQLSELRDVSKAQHPGVWAKNHNAGADQEGEHGKNVVVLLNSKLENMTDNLKEVLKTRMENVMASKSRTENFVSSVSSYGQSSLDPSRTDSPLYATPSSRSRSPRPGYKQNNAAAGDLLSLEPSSSSALTRAGPQSEQQLLLMEEAQAPNTYIQQRGEAIDMIEKTISELGGMFTQLAQMVSEQGEQIQRIDADTEDVVENVQGAQRELMKYWNRVSGNRWLIAKMFGVLMICE
jgi:syntaxin 5